VAALSLGHGAVPGVVAEAWPLAETAGR
jgi:hypothetical protein